MVTPQTSVKSVQPILKCMNNLVIHHKIVDYPLMFALHTEIVNLTLSQAYSYVNAILAILDYHVIVAKIMLMEIVILTMNANVMKAMKNLLITNVILEPALQIIRFVTAREIAQSSAIFINVCATLDIKDHFAKIASSNIT